ncbi:PIR Superfamily Protein [Plasmodium ovale wallikeri]|uniref:PIR Superfamily Protein n=1 Tax=Plasmodium ovale wallikeri TaxID=864142 RepID=A0A1A9AKM9_PLAOA|nr:PIR Superfamily Protein [Plasmodium ovale wallikeri]
MSSGAEYSEFWEKIKEVYLIFFINITTQVFYFHTFTKNVTLGNFYNKFEDMCSYQNNQDYCAIEKDGYNGCDNFNKLYYNLNGNKAKYDHNNEEFSTLYEYPINFCNYLKYWFYDKIIFNKFQNDQIIKLLKDLNNAGKFQFHMAKDYTCNFNILELDKIKEVKLFYDYIGSYDSEEKKSSIHDKICGIDYEDSLDKIIELYNNRNAYCTNKTNPYCDEFVELDSLPQDSTGLYTSGGKLHQDSALGDTENTSIRITMSVIPIIVTLFIILPILYKLTPFGTLLHKSITRTKNFLSSSNENSTYTLLNHISESDNINLMERTLYIAYHSS